MTVRRMRRWIVVWSMVVVLGACSSAGEEVASLDGHQGDGMVDGYANAATARYAECLESKGIEVFPTKAAQQTGYLEIAGGQFMGDADGTVTDSSPLGVDGVNRQADVDECRAANPDYRDIYTHHADEQIVPGGGSGMQGQIAAGQEWAQCARDAGFPLIEDPVDGVVTIPAEITLEQAALLGRTCSRPIESLDDPSPSFNFQGGEYDPETDSYDSTALSQAIEGPIAEHLDLSENDPSPTS